MKKIRAAIVGYGNIGRAAIEAIETSPDFEVAGIVRRGGTEAKVDGYRVVGDIADLLDGNVRGASHMDAAGCGCAAKTAGADGDRGVDVAIVCSPSREVERQATKALESGLCTVDSFDIHTEIVGLRGRLGTVAAKNGAVAVISAGWDPGSDSVVRALLEACAPDGTSHTNFGPGMSMGHSVAARAIPGVRNALSMTIPVGGGIHRREVYIETEPADFDAASAAIRADPYFAHDDTQVSLVADVAALVDVTHGVKIVRDGASGHTGNQKFEFSMRINNPALTGQILVSAARAAVRMRARGEKGAFTMIELAPVDLLAGDREDIVKRLV